MRILLQGRKNLFLKSGGDTIQIIQIKKHLNYIGLDADISLELNSDLKDYDIVHVFNISRIYETYQQFINAKEQGKKIVCTPIYQNLWEYNRKGRYGLAKYIFKLVRSDNLFEKLRSFLVHANSHRLSSLAIIQSIKQQQKTVLLESDAIIYTSRLEKEDIEKDLISRERAVSYFFIPTSVETDLEQVDAQQFLDKFGYQDFVICAARIEDLKNQLQLIKALQKSSDIRLVLVGDLNNRHRSYGIKVKKALRDSSNIQHFSGLSRSLVLSAMAAAKVHVQPSWFENVGLSSLEAGLLGCNIVTTNRGYAREYFDDLAWYCSPADFDSIRKAVKEAFNSEYNGELCRRIREKYTWEININKLRHIYEGLFS